METNTLIGWATCALAVVGSVMLARPLLGAHGLRRLLVVIDSVEVKLRDDGLSADEGAVAFHDVLLDVATMYVMVASGCVPFFRKRHTSASLPKRVRDSLSYVEQNAWTWPYVASALYRTQIALFLGRPWNPFLLGRAIAAAVALALYEQKDGGVDLTWARSTSRQKLENAVRSDSMADCMFSPS